MDEIEKFCEKELEDLKNLSEICKLITFLPKEVKNETK